MKRVLTLCAVTVVAVVLAACNVTITPPGPPANTIDVTANMNPSASVAGPVAISPGQSQVFRVAPGAAVNADLVYVELDRDIELEVLPTSYQSVIFSANDRSRFARERFGIQSVDAATEQGLESQAVLTNITCRGSCVIQRGSSVSGEFFVRVRNDSGTTSNVSLFAYGDSFGDGTEPANNSTATAPVLGAFDSGAIETVGDVDFWLTSATGNVNFRTATNGPALQAFIVDASGNVVAGGGPFTHGQNIPVFAGDFIRVWTTDSRFAASSARSRYDLEYTTPLVQER